MSNKSLVQITAQMNITFFLNACDVGLKGMIDLMVDICKIYHLIRCSMSLTLKN